VLVGNGSLETGENNIDKNPTYAFPQKNNLKASEIIGTPRIKKWPDLFVSIVCERRFKQHNLRP